MEYKNMDIIPKFLDGGAYYSNFMSVYTPPQIPNYSKQGNSRLSSSGEEKEDTKGRLTHKDVFDLLKGMDGLPNEMNMIITNMLNTLNNTPITEMNYRQITAMLLRNLLMLKTAEYNKEAFKNAYTQAVNNKSLNEAAIDNSGHIWVIESETRKLKLVSPEKWSKLKETGKYDIVTNGELLWMRSHLREYANQNEIFRIVENGIGLEEVHKMIKDRFQKMTNSETSRDFYVPKEAIKGNKILESMLQYGPEGYYKITEDLSQPELEQINATLSYIYSTLPDNAKTRLALETEDGSLNSVVDVIKSLVFGTLNTKSTYKSEYVGEEGRGITKDGKSVKSSKAEDNVATKLIKGYGYIENYGINLGDEYLTYVKTNTLPLVGKDDKDLGVRLPISDVFEGSLGRVLDTRSASIAGSIVSTIQFNRIIVDENKIRSIDYPSIRTEQGLIVPDLSAETREKKRDADSELYRMGINPYDSNDKKEKYRTINEIYQKHELPAPYSPNGEINNDTWSRFAIVTVYTDARAIPGADTSLLEKVDDDYTIESIEANIQESDKTYSYNSSILGVVGGDPIYKGTLWMPLLESYGIAMGPETTETTESMRLDIVDLAIRRRALLTTKQYK